MDKTWKFLNDYSFGITLNANDTFAYACADAVTVDLLDVPKLIQMEEKYGHCGVTAFMAKIRNDVPIKPHITDKYQKARSELYDYILFEDVDVDNKSQWNNWWKEYQELTGEDKTGELL